MRHRARLRALRIETRQVYQQAQEQAAGQENPARGAGLPLGSKLVEGRGDVRVGFRGQVQPAPAAAKASLSGERRRPAPIASPI